MEALGVCPSIQHYPDTAPKYFSKTPSTNKSNRNSRSPPLLPTFEVYVDSHQRVSTDYYSNFLSFILCREDGQESYEAAINHWPELPSDNIAIQHILACWPILLDWIDKAKDARDDSIVKDMVKRTEYESGFEGDSEGEDDGYGRSFVVVGKGGYEGDDEEEEEEEASETEQKHNHELCSGSDADDEKGILWIRKKYHHRVSKRRRNEEALDRRHSYKSAKYNRRRSSPGIYPILKRKRGIEQVSSDESEDQDGIRNALSKRIKSSRSSSNEVSSDEDRDNSKGKMVIRGDTWRFTDIINKK